MQTLGRPPEVKLFVIAQVQLQVPLADLPEPPVSRGVCYNWEKTINHRRGVERDGQTLCRACAFGAYYDTIPSGTGIGIPQEVTHASSD